ncbi:ATP-dependent 6-phosphofructokinase [Fundidesulfovibrio magnetotacticus]|uniref:ATP-dependent 6-phosphofructokinase n=1 Tax=Fundidesulfovibrio magnetotacticus TaxID=2730080 RepID=A0A6V8LRU1_9BACT|nr:ATP-dependent 6-phosphofructokinase [Fundidesulfovibrio magnetotacticus]GFK93271.1 ATP-dependent 6-phosphofructokinase [Fundidesulfovibrio magnetotacticus]
MHQSEHPGQPWPHLDAEKTRTPSLGAAKIPNPRRHSLFVDDEQGVLVNILHPGHGKRPSVASLEQAGPRRMIYFDPPKTKCAVVTCGGICPGTNDVIRSIVMEAHHGYGVSGVLGVRYGLAGFIPKTDPDVMELSPTSVADIHEFGGTVLGTSRGPQDPEDVVDALERLNVGMLFVMGGVGSMRAAQAIQAVTAARGLRIAVVCIPKTVDNDIHFVSRTFGFESAVEKVIEAVRCAHVEATGAPYGIGVVKVMGRESGFIAAAAALSIKEVNFVLAPEEPVVLEGPGGFLPALEARLRRRGHAVVLVAEGAGQDLLPESGLTDASGNKVLGDICGLLISRTKAYFKERLPINLKFIDPSYIIRSVPASGADRAHCNMLGAMAVHAGMAGKTGIMVSRLHEIPVHVPLPLVTVGRKVMDVRSSAWQQVLDTTGQSRLRAEPA